jgi:hypothetical protein
VEQEWLLGNDPDLTANLLKGKALQTDSVEEHFSGGRIVKARDQ